MKAKAKGLGSRFGSDGRLVTYMAGCSGPLLHPLLFSKPFSSSSSPAGRIAQAKAAMYAGEGDYAYVNEVDALVYFLTAYPERKFDEDGQSLHVEDMGSVVVDAGKPVDLRVYAPDGKRDWKEYNKKVETQYPLVVFSKTYCP